MSHVMSELEKKSPTDDSIRLITEVSQFIKSDNLQLNEWATEYISRFQRRFAFDFDLAKRFSNKNSNILEVGASPPVLTCALKKSGYKITGVDIAPERFASTLKDFDIKVHKCDFEKSELPFDDETFDCIVFNEIFEHLRINPIFSCVELNRVMKPDGILLLSTPNPHSALGMFRFLLLGQTLAIGGSVFSEFSKLTEIGHMGHVREYGTTEVIQFFQSIGFSAEKVIFRSRDKIRLRPASLNPFVSYVFKKKSSQISADQNKPLSFERLPKLLLVIAFLVTLPLMFSTRLAVFLIGRRIARRLGLPVI